jgi:hypothetical protein
LHLGLIERGAVIAVVDAGDHVAGGDTLVVSDRNGGDVSGDLRGERGLSAAIKASSVDWKRSA